MSRRVEWTEPAAKDIERLDRQARERIRQAVYRLADTGHGDVNRLTAKGKELRLKVGPWRVRFEHDNQAGLLRILRVLSRREDTYRD